MYITKARSIQTKWLDLFALVICVLLSALKPVPFPWKVPLIAVLIIGYCKLIHGSISVIGMKRHRVVETIVWGAGTALIIVVMISNVFNPLLERLLSDPVDTSAYGLLKGNATYVLNYWWKAMLSAAISEEIFYRGFGFFVFTRLFGKSILSHVLIVVLMATYFGLSHAFQGPVGVMGIFMAALVFGSAYLMSNKNLWALILAHALVDTWSLFSLYKGGISLFF